MEDLASQIDKVLKKLIADVPKEEREDYRAFFNTHTKLLMEGRKVEAEALATKFKKEHGS